jgi:hypothetical protein
MLITNSLPVNVSHLTNLNRLFIKMSPLNGYEIKPVLQNTASHKYYRLPVH